LQFTVDIIKIAEVVGAAAVIIGVIVGFVKWVIRQSEQDKDIADMKEEQTLICYAIKACLDGLEQLGANHTVPKAKNDLEKYLNKKAHEQPRDNNIKN